MTTRIDFLLRMDRSNDLVKSQPVLAGYAMLIDDLDAYLRVNPKSEMAIQARKCLVKSRSLFQEGDRARERAFRTKDQTFLEKYYTKLAREATKLKEGESLLLLGGPFDHAIVHQIERRADSRLRLKTYNGRPIIRGHLHFETEIHDFLPPACFTKEVMRDLFSHKFSSGTRQEQLRVIFNTLDELKKKIVVSQSLPDDPSCQHKLRPDNSCLRSAFLYWLKEDGLKGEYHSFKIAFGNEALKTVRHKLLQNLGKEKIEKWQKRLQKMKMA